MTENLRRVSKAGVSIWLDDLSRARLTSGNLKSLISDYSVVGVTTNPSIFQAAIAKSTDYAGAIAKLKGESAEAVVEKLTTEDVRDACDLFTPVYEASKRIDGRVSIEVDPRFAHDGEKTIAQARELWKIVGRPNAMIKIPATLEGLPAITTAISEGISVNVTLIFSLERYRLVAEAYIAGLEKAAEAGLDLSRIQSVASFFVSRVDTDIDSRLEKIGTPEALELRGKAGLANAQIAYEAFEEIFSSERFAKLAERGAVVQRPLWASTGVKNPEYSPVLYVDGLVAPNVVNTMPEKTLLAAAELSQASSDTITPALDEAHAVMARLAEVGIDVTEVTDLLERDGVAKFEEAWESLLDTVREQL